MFLARSIVRAKNGELFMKSEYWAALPVLAGLPFAAERPGVFGYFSLGGDGNLSVTGNLTLGPDPMPTPRVFSEPQPTSSRAIGRSASELPRSRSTRRTLSR